MRYFNAITLVGLASAAPHKLRMDMDQFGSFIEGMTSGFFEQQMPNIVACLS